MNELHVLVRVEGQGYGYMSAGEYDAIPAAVKGRVELLAACPSEETARWLFEHLPQEWREVNLAWRPSTGEVREVTVGAVQIETLAKGFMAREQGDDS